MSDIGGDNLRNFEINVDDWVPTEGDLLFAALHQRSRILQRTERGVDFELGAFAPYNRTRPYYFYPNGKVSQRRSATELRRAKSAVSRFAKKVGRRSSARTRSGLGIRFDSYADFKLSYLGRSNVDLRGARAPHMLQAMVIRSAGQEIKGTNDKRVGMDESDSPGTTVTIGIYGDEAKRAAGLGGENRPKGMPRRDFLNSSEDDNERFGRDLLVRVTERSIKFSKGR